MTETVCLLLLELSQFLQQISSRSEISDSVLLGRWLGDDWEKVSTESKPDHQYTLAHKVAIVLFRGCFVFSLFISFCTHH